MNSASVLCRFGRPAAPRAWSTSIVFHAPRIQSCRNSLLHNSRCGPKRNAPCASFWHACRGVGSPHVRWMSDAPEPKQKQQSSTEAKPAKPALVERLKSLTPHENIYTIPNILTFSRLAAAPALGWLVLTEQHHLAAGLLAYAAATDLVDGWLARRLRQETVVGTVIDPMADKALMTILTVALAAKGALPLWVASLIIGRDVGLAISAIYYRYISLPPPKTFARYWDFSLPSAEVHPTAISKANTALQLGLIGWTVCMPLLAGYGPWMETALVGMQYLVATTTVWSGLSYVYSKDAVKILSAEDIEKRRRKAQGKQ